MEAKSEEKSMWIHLQMTIKKKDYKVEMIKIHSESLNDYIKQNLRMNNIQMYTSCF